MNWRIVFGVLLALALVGGAIGIGAYAYDAGVAQGLAESGKLVAPEAGVMPYRYYGGPFFHPRPFGFGFGFLGCLFPLLFFFLISGLLRGLFWRGPWGWGHGGGWRGGPGMRGKGAPPMFEEWHRQAHSPSAGQPQEPPTTTT